jgi:hypothetical protein
MWHKMIEGWQCNEGMGFRFAFPADHFTRTVYFKDGVLTTRPGTPPVPPSVLAWVLAPVGSERPPEAARSN